MIDSATVDNQGWPQLACRGNRVVGRHRPRTTLRGSISRSSWPLISAGWRTSTIEGPSISSYYQNRVSGHYSIGGAGKGDGGAETDRRESELLKLLIDAIVRPRMPQVRQPIRKRVTARLATSHPCPIVALRPTDVSTPGVCSLATLVWLRRDSTAIIFIPHKRAPQFGTRLASPHPGPSRYSGGVAASLL